MTAQSRKTKNNRKSIRESALENRRQRMRLWLQAALLLGLAIMVYVPSLQSGKIFDDNVFVFENDLVKAPDGLAKFWFSTKPVDYFPLTSTALWFEWRIFGDNPAGYHAVNIALHAIACVLVWRALLLLNIPGAWLAALLFAVHPVNVASVSWITELKNTLPMVFFLLSASTYLRFIDEGQPVRRRRFYAASLTAFLLALLAKTSVVMLPPALLLCAWWKRRRIEPVDWMRTAPFFALSFILGLVTVWYQSHNNIGSAIVRSDGFIARLATAGWAVWFYLYKAFLPINLSFMYPRWEVDAGWWGTYVPLALLIACFMVFRRYRSSWARPCLFALSFFVLFLLPVLGFVDMYFMIYSFAADHWQYISLIAVVSLVAAGLVRLSEQPGFKKPAVAVMAAVAVILSALTWQRQQAFSNSEALWKDTLAKNPSAWAAYANMGNIMFAKGRFEDALVYYKRSLRLKDDFAETHNNMGNSLKQLGRIDEAAAAYTEALRIDPKNALAHNNLGSVLQAQGTLEAGIAEYREAVRLKPDLAEAQINLGSALHDKKDLGKAIMAYQEALRLKPDYALVRYNLGLALQENGQFDEAVAQFNEALRLAPEFTGAKYNLGVALQKLGRFEEAIAQYREVIERKPDDARVLSDLAAAYAGLGKFQEAAQWQEKAVALAPADKAEAFKRRLEMYKQGRKYGDTLLNYPPSEMPDN